MDNLNEVWVVAVDMDRMMVFFETGERCPITNMIDVDNNETDDPDEAAKLVFRIDSLGKWGACTR